MGFKLKKLRKIASAPTKIVKSAVKNKTLQTVARVGAGVYTSGQSELVLGALGSAQGRLKSARGSEIGQAIESTINEASKENTPTIQTKTMLNSPKNNEKQDSFVESVKESATKAIESVSNSTGISTKIVVMIAIGLGVFFYLKRKK